MYTNYPSNNKLVSCGVPQGSLLGPLLFILYINDVENCLKYLNPILYADDTTIFINGSNIEDLII